MMDIKPIAFYLPQFHCFPENDQWWGTGFTEWTNTRKAKPLFKGHYQPHVPYRENYYNLLDEGVMRKQVETARRYGVYGFCFYHYWFKGKLLMEKPIESFLHDKSLNIHFCLSWANESWTRRWDGGNQEVLIKQEYGDVEEWKKHFYYLLPFFEDHRYIRINGCPVIVIYRPEIIPCYNEMIDTWRRLARENGLNNLHVMAQGSEYCSRTRIERKIDATDSYIMYEPGYSIMLAKKLSLKTVLESFPINVEGLWRLILRKMFESVAQKNEHIAQITEPKIFGYDSLWKVILKHKLFPNVYPGAFVTWDNTPRKGKNARIITNSSPEKFGRYMQSQLYRTKNEYHKEYIFITAWNEWAEGSHLEPDEKYEYRYLEALKKALEKTK